MDEKELLDAESPARGQEPLRKRLSRDKDRIAREGEQQHGRHAARLDSPTGDHFRRSLQFRLHVSSARGGADVKNKDGDQDRGVEKIQLLLEGNDERVESGQAEVKNLDLVRRLQVKGLLAGFEPIGKDYGRPSDPDEQSVCPGHVRRRVGGVLGIFPRHPGEIHVHGILGQDREEGEDGQG